MLKHATRSLHDPASVMFYLGSLLIGAFIGSGIKVFAILGVTLFIGAVSLKVARHDDAQARKALEQRATAPLSELETSRQIHDLHLQILGREPIVEYWPEEEPEEKPEEIEIKPMAVQLPPEPRSAPTPRQSADCVLRDALDKIVDPELKLRIARLDERLRSEAVGSNIPYSTLLFLAIKREENRMQQSR